eukprot:15473936-Alexandrium_andersonii.AAC.1
MDRQLDAVSTRLRHALSVQDADGFWQTFSAAVEAAFMKRGGLQGRDAEKHAGHGKVVLKHTH